MNVVAYCRVSTNEENQKNSLKNQESFFENYAKENGYNLVGIYCDEGISGTKLRNRTAFLKMIDDAKLKNFEKVLVKDVSRFARNTVDFLNSTRKLESYNVKTIFLSSENVEQSEFVMTLFAAVAQEESVNLSKRIKFSKQQSALKGKVPNLIFGYDKIVNDKFNLKINQREASIIDKMFNMFVFEGKSASFIARTLNYDNILTKRGCKWQCAGVLRVLRNQIYIGNIVNGKERNQNIWLGKRLQVDLNEWVFVENPTVQIIDKEIFEKAQEILMKKDISYECSCIL